MVKNFHGRNWFEPRLRFRETAPTLLVGVTAMTGVLLALGVPPLWASNIGAIAAIPTFIAWWGAHGLCRSGFSTLLLAALALETGTNYAFDGNSITLGGTFATTASLSTLGYMFGKGLPVGDYWHPGDLSKNKDDTELDRL